MQTVDVLVRISPIKEAVVRIDEELILAGGWRQAAKERAAVLMGWSIFDIERARVGLRPEDRDRLIAEHHRRHGGDRGTDCRGASGPSQ